MAQKNSQMPTARRKAAPSPVAPVRSAVATHQCLVLSPSYDRRNMLRTAATDSGWRAIVCADAETARIASSRQRFALALVDLDIDAREPAVEREYRDLLRELASQGDVLLAICGNDERGSDEMFARQLGAWMYLAGVTASDDLAMVCGEARQIADKLAAAEARASPTQEV